MKQKGIWLRNGWRLHHLNAAELALALLVVQYSDQLNLSGAAYLSFLILAVNLLARAAAALVRRLVRR